MVDGRCVVVCLYVDDLLIFASDLDLVRDVKNFLSSKFDMKDLGEANVILGIKLTKSVSGITLSQSHYTEKVLEKYGYLDCKPIATPFDPSVHLKKHKGEPVNQDLYAQIIGSLMYFSNRTQPDIAYSVSRLSRYTSNPNQEHWIALERVLRFLKGTMSLGLRYTGFPSVVEGYTDAN